MWFFMTKVIMNLPMNGQKYREILNVKKFCLQQLLLLHSFLIFLLYFATESWCGLALQPSLDFQNPKPKYLIFVGFVICVFVAFTFKPSFLSIQLVTVYITLFAAASLFTTITQRKMNILGCKRLSSSGNSGRCQRNGNGD